MRKTPNNSLLPASVFHNNFPVQCILLSSQSTQSFDDVSFEHTPKMKDEKVRIFIWLLANQGHFLCIFTCDLSIYHNVQFYIFILLGSLLCVWYQCSKQKGVRLHAVTRENIKQNTSNENNLGLHQVVANRYGIWKYIPLSVKCVYIRKFLYLLLALISEYHYLSFETESIPQG